MLKRCFYLLLIAMSAGTLFNLAAPQGIGFLPPEITNSLWEPVHIQRAADLWKQKAAFVDAREPGEYQRSQIRGAVNLYPSELHLLYPLLEKFLRQKETILVYGKSFSRFPAATIAQFLKQKGYGKVLVMEATFEDWKKAGLPVREVKRGKSS
jgi:rhodanese-related sulfurtransferase